jgi:hypothetical protein
MLLMSLGVFESQRRKDSKTQRWVIAGVKCIPRIVIFFRFQVLSGETQNLKPCACGTSLDQTHWFL